MSGDDIDWIYWANFADVTLEQAVALSCDHDPRTIDTRDHYAPRAYVERREITFSHVYASTLKPSRTVQGYSGPSIYRFTLPQFAAFAIARRWSLPSQFPKPPAIATPAPTPVTQTPSTSGVMIALPHTTRALESIFAIIRRHWEKFDGTTEPSQTAIALEIGEAMNWKPETSGKPARAAQAIAGLFRPDKLAEADRRTALGKIRK